MLKILESQLLAKGMAYEKTCTAATAKEITHFFIRTNSVRTSRLKLLKAETSSENFHVWKFKQREITLKIIHIPLENMLTKR